MVATARQQYVGRSLRIGDLFEVDSEAEAADLEVMRFAVRDQTVRPPQYDTKALEATGAQSIEEKPVGSGRYKRRDMRAGK